MDGDIRARRAEKLRSQPLRDALDADGEGRMKESQGSVEGAEGARLRDARTPRQPGTALGVEFRQGHPDVAHQFKPRGGVAQQIPQPASGKPFQGQDTASPAGSQRVRNAQHLPGPKHRRLRIRLLVAGRGVEPKYGSGPAGRLQPRNVSPLRLVTEGRDRSVAQIRSIGQDVAEKATAAAILPQPPEGPQLAVVWKDRDDDRRVVENHSAPVHQTRHARSLVRLSQLDGGVRSMGLGVDFER
jgi:hypothetical protein